jgi:hypothetical protein
MSIKASLQGSILTLLYTTIVHLPQGYHDKNQIKRYEDESVKLCDDYMKNLRKLFRESAGRSLKVKQIDTSDSLQMINYSNYSPRKTFYYRRITVFDIE